MDQTPGQTRRDFLYKGALAASGVGLFSIGASAKETAAGFSAALAVTELAREVPLIPRSEWAADVKPRRHRMRLTRAFELLTLHHSGVSVKDMGDHRNSVMSHLDNTLAGHLQLNYGDLGYHFAIDHVGRVWEGRSLRYEGAHVSHHNVRNIGIVLLGNFEKDNPTAVQLRSMKALSLRLAEHYGIVRQHIVGHRDLAASACPGRLLYPYVRSLGGETKS